VARQTFELARCGCTLRETSQTTYPKVTTTTICVHNHMFKCRNAQLLVVMLCYVMLCYVMLCLILIFF
jgi:hypothetical protein